jgi:hypothetical protein
MGGPVDYRSAERFRWVVVAIVSGLLIAFYVVLALPEAGIGILGGWPFVAWDSLYGNGPLDSIWELETIWYAGASLVPVLPLGIIIAVLIWTAAPTYWFHPRRLAMTQQNRAVALGRYAAGSLVWLWIPGIALGTTVFYEGTTFPAAPDGGAMTWYFFTLEPWVCYIVTGLILLTFLRNVILLLARATRCGAGRVAGAAFSTVAGLIVGAVIGLVLLPGVAGFLWLVGDSLISPHH